MDDATHQLRFLKDRLAPGAALTRPLAAMNRVLYCHCGAFATTEDVPEDAPPDALTDKYYSEDQAWFGDSAVTFAGGPEGAEIWRWELAPAASTPATKLGPAIETEIALVEPVTLTEKAGRWLMRCDGVKFPPNGCAFTHVHQGPSVRVMCEGTVQIRGTGGVHDYSPGDVWFEDGPSPVFVQAAAEGCTRFIRVMILPADLKGKSSIRYVNEEDREKPKTQRYTGYIDECINL